MYCNYYGFSEKPFDITPDPRFLFLTHDHRETLASIVYGIQERRGFITIIGEVGTGKTTLLNAAMHRMDEKTRVAFIFNTNVTFNEILNIALYEWELTNDIEKLSNVKAIQRLNRFAIENLAQGGNVVLIVDEAQNLDNRVMENLRLLSNLETPRHKLIQIVLSGQPELYIKLSRHELRQLAQRISLKRYVSPLDEKDTYAYLQHRLKVVQDSGAFPFTTEAKKLIWKYSKGVPRKINILCDNAFLIGYGMKMKKINGDVVWEAVQDLTWHSSLDAKPSLDISSSKNNGFTFLESKPPRRSLTLIATMIVVGILILTGSLFLNSKEFQLAKLTDFISNIKKTTLETIHRIQAKDQVQLSRSDIPEPGIMKPKIIRQKVPKENLELETQAINKEIAYLTLSKYHIVKDKKPNLIDQINRIEKTWEATELNENDHSEIQIIEEDKQNLSIPEIQVYEKEKSGLTAPIKEKIIRQTVVKNGDTLGRIIVKTYGAYDDIILTKVQRQNPKIIDPDLILPGQIIKLPADKE
jgi:general secretion pathway protein A